MAFLWITKVIYWVVLKKIFWNYRSQTSVKASVIFVDASVIFILKKSSSNQRIHRFEPRITNGFLISSQTLLASVILSKLEVIKMVKLRILQTF